MVGARQSGNSLFFENEHNDLSCFSLPYNDFFPSNKYKPILSVGKVPDNFWKRSDGKWRKFNCHDAVGIIWVCTRYCRS